MLSGYFLRRHEAGTEDRLDYWYEVVERVKAHPLGVESERSVCVVHSEATGRIVVDELNRQRRAGVAEGIARRRALAGEGEG
jgi:hypothetical protein